MYSSLIFIGGHIICQNVFGVLEETGESRKKHRSLGEQKIPSWCGLGWVLTQNLQGPNATSITLPPHLPSAIYNTSIVLHGRWAFGPFRYQSPGTSATSTLPIATLKTSLHDHPPAQDQSPWSPSCSRPVSMTPLLLSKYNEFSQILRTWCQIFYIITSL